MANRNSAMSCQAGCWALAAGVGLLACVLLLVIGGYGWIAAIFIGGLLFLVLGFLFSWIFCSPMTSAGAAATSGGAASPAKPQAAAPAPSQPAAPAAAPAADTAPSTSASARADAEAGASVKPTTALPGQQELSTRKGEWRYGGGDNRTPSAAAAAATAGSTEAAAAEVEGPGEKPATLDGPREGGADDLKRIKGIGPKLETLCNDLGFYHFDQIAAWTPQEVAWVDQNLEGFKGRVTRDEWVAQAKLLAEGGETDFSQKVDKGDVY